MPRLPDDSVLGGLPSANSGRAIATFDTSAPGRAMDALGQGIARAGAGIARGIESFTEDQDNLALNKAKSGYLTEKVAIDEELSRENDPEKIKAFPQRYEELSTRWGGTLSNPRHKEAWNNDMMPRVAADGARARTNLFNAERNQELADADELADMMQQIGADPKQSDENRQAALEVMQERIDELQKRGYINPLEAQTRHKQWARGYAWSSLRAVSPAERIAAMGGGSTPADVAKAYEGMNETQHADVLMEVFRKTGGQVINPQKTPWCGAFVDGILGLSGKAQRGSLRAADFLNYGTPTDAPSKGDVVVFKPQAAGSSGHVGFVISVDGDKVRYIAGNDANKVQEATLPLGEVAGFRVPPPAGSPLPAGMETSKRGENLAQKAETYTRSSRAAQMADFLTSDDRVRMTREAEAELKRQDTTERNQRKEVSAVIENDVEQDLRSMEVTGVGREGLTREKVQAALGPKAAQEWEANRTRAKQIYDAVGTGTELLTKDELDDRVNSIRPKGGEGDFTEQEATYAKARKKADAIISERENDPAIAAERHPVLKQARQAAQYEGEGPTRTLAPASAQSIVAARMKVQEQLGILDPSPITRNEGAIIARQLRMIGEDNSAGLDRFMRTLERTYGEYAKYVLSSALTQEKVNRDLSNAATDILFNIVKGNAVTPAQAAPAVSAVDNQQLTDAMSGQVRQGSERRSAFGKAFREGERAQAVEMRQRAETRDAEPSVTYDPADVRALWDGRANPDMVMNFELKYGPKTAEKILKDIERRMKGGR